MSQFYTGVTAGSLPPVVATSYLLDDGNSAVPAANVLQVSGGTGAATSLGVPNQIIITFHSYIANMEGKATQYNQCIIRRLNKMIITTA